MKRPVKHAILYNLWKICAGICEHNRIAAMLYTKLRKKLYKPKYWPETAKQVALEYIERVRVKQELLVDKLKKQEAPIRICFTVIYDSVFQAEPLFIKMIDDARFDPYILVIPDTARGAENEENQLQKTYNSLRAKYGDFVLCSRPCGQRCYKDFSSEMDIVCPANPYDDMTHPLYRIEYLCSKALPIFFNYAYPNDHYSYTHIASIPSISLVWKYFTESESVTDIFKKHMLNKGENIVTVGYIKMDRLSEQALQQPKRKSIILAPHHSVGRQCADVYAISTFMQHADFFLELPKLYPSIDFIFRPHPLLYPTLAQKSMWGKEKTERYFQAIQAHPNITYQNGGDYFPTFATANGIIHDCGSYVSEWVYTHKPMCFMLKCEENIDKFFMKNGADVLRRSYLAYSAEDIKHFIEEVIIKENDSKQQLTAEISKEVMFNYPNATACAFNHIKSALS